MYYLGTILIKFMYAKYLPLLVTYNFWDDFFILKKVSYRNVKKFKLLDTNEKLFYSEPFCKRRIPAINDRFDRT